MTSQTEKRPELLAPAGKFMTAYYAFKAGADGVYLGLERFSARAAAQNFSRDSLRRLRTLASESEKKIYVAVNTVIRQEEIGSLLDDLFFLEQLGVDGAIVQEPALAQLIKKHFPSLAVHASTQMAAGSAMALKAVRELGAGRVILPRELTLDDIRQLKHEHPDIELEVFIHGSLCYCCSGLCLASWKLSGRSGNRGECAQVCRSDYTLRGHPAHCFSCRDLFLGEDVLCLAEAGVDAFKIEGRLRSPEYVFHSVAYYRYLLDNPRHANAGKLRAIEGSMRRTFFRTDTKGYLRGRAAGNLIDREFSTHLGAELGTVEDVRGKGFTLRLNFDLSLRDGVLFFESGDRSRPQIFSIMKIQKGKRPVATAAKGDRVTLFPPVLPEKGQTVYHHSSRLLALKNVREASFRPARCPLDISVELAPASMTVSFSIAGTRGSWTRELVIDRARETNDFPSILKKVFQESGENLYGVRDISFVNRTGLPDGGIFIPPSELKKARNGFYEYLNAFVPEASGAMKKAVLDEAAAFVLNGAVDAGEPDRAFLGRRASLNVRCDREGRPFSLPFVLDFASLRKEQLACREGVCYLPLDPLSSGQDYLDAARQFLQAHEGSRFLVGLNNVGHLKMANGLKNLFNTGFFVDYCLYVANIFSFRLFHESAQLAFQYFWIEGSEADYNSLRAFLGNRLGHSLVRITDTEDIPLFISKTCFAKNNGLCSCGKCPRFLEYSLSQGKNRFRVVVYNCVTYLY